MKAHVYPEKPDPFHPTVAIAAIYLFVKDHFLILKRSPHTLAGNYWGLPAGKLESSEPPLHAAKRELQEETALTLSLDRFRPLKTLYVKRTDLDFLYHPFHVTLNERPSIHLSHEHTEFQWVTIDEARRLPLLPGGEEALLLTMLEISK